MCIHKPSPDCVSHASKTQCLNIFCLPLQIFDMKEFKNHIAEELRKPTIESARLHRLCLVSFSFIRNTFDDMDTPCWVTVINFTALNTLGKDQSEYRL